MPASKCHSVVRVLGLLGMVCLLSGPDWPLMRCTGGSHMMMEEAVGNSQKLCCCRSWGITDLYFRFCCHLKT